MQLTLLTLASLAALVSAAPLTLQQGYPEDNVASLVALKPRSVKKWQLPPLRQDAKVDSIGRVQQLQKIRQELGGHSQVVEKTEGAVTHNGRLLESLSRSLETRTAPGAGPQTSSATELKVPSLGLHQRLVAGDLREEKVEQAVDPETVAELSSYVADTGDQASVVQFLQLLLQEGKLTEDQALLYVDGIKKELEGAERRRGEGREQEAPRDSVERIREMVAAEEREKEESRAAEVLEKAKVLKEAAAGVEREEEEHQLILRINDYLEASLSEGKISRNLYDHLKEALIESVVEGMRADVGALGGADYTHY